jgi:hypothetical protein
MADKQTDADKAAAMKEYRAQHDAAVDRIAALRAARLAREASAPPPEPKVKAKAGAKSTKTSGTAAGKTAGKTPAKARAVKAAGPKVLLAKSRM